MGLEMVVQVVEWEWIYEMDVVEVVVVVEVDGRDSMESGMKDIEGNIEDVKDFPNKDLSNHVRSFHMWCSSNSITDDSVRLWLFQRTLTWRSFQVVCRSGLLLSYYVCDPCQGFFVLLPASPSL